jgi:hypothetical protein
VVINGRGGEAGPPEKEGASGPPALGPGAPQGVSLAPSPGGDGLLKKASLPGRHRRRRACLSLAGQYRKYVVFGAGEARRPSSERISNRACHRGHNKQHRPSFGGHPLSRHRYRGSILDPRTLLSHEIAPGCPARFPANRPASEKPSAARSLAEWGVSGQTRPPPSLPQWTGPPAGPHGRGGGRGSATRA